MSKINILLLCGGGATEHDISLISAKHIYQSLASIPDTEVFQIELCKDGSRKDSNGKSCELRKNGEIYFHESNEAQLIHFAIPCFHGPPGESGEIQAIFEQMQLPYLGSGSEASAICFNKVTTKLWLDSLKIENTPYIFLHSIDEMDRAKKYLSENGILFIKASNQGSSVGCYKVHDEDELLTAVEQAFKLSSYVLLEKAVIARELEVAVYELDGKIIATDPGEIICPDGFYTYKEKYDKQSHTSTILKAEGLESEQLEKIQNYALKAFKALKLRDLARIDFFLTSDGEVLLNEINTFPGMTPISMFPKMLESHGTDFTQFLTNRIQSKKKKD